MPGGAGILAAGYKGLYKMGGPLSMKDMHGKYLLSKPQKKSKVSKAKILLLVDLREIVFQLRVEGTKKKKIKMLFLFLFSELFFV